MLLKSNLKKWKFREEEKLKYSKKDYLIGAKDSYFKEILQTNIRKFELSKQDI
jgi:hypothetical protein